jgi:hypothetical protein
MTRTRTSSLGALRTFEEYEDLLLPCIKQAQSHGDIDPDANLEQLAVVPLAVLRGIEALGSKAGRSAASLQAIADGALAVLPRPRPACDTPRA